jgi:RNA polymerase sigma-70 factor (ECF subfamily)
VAFNAFIDETRKRKPISYHDTNLQIGANTEHLECDFFKYHDLLHMIIICCDLDIPKQSRLILSLKILCGFKISEIAQRLFLSESNVQKRYQRARQTLREKSDKFNRRLFDVSDISTEHIDSLLSLLYALFTEGYLSYSIDFSIRFELCEEVDTLLKVFVHMRVGNKPKIYALLSLITLHLARMNSRQGSDNRLILLEEQDRNIWDADLINKGFCYLAASADGGQLSRYHLEAAIAAEHCRANSFSGTNWETICQYYEQLESLFTSYFYRLNRAIALAEWKGPNEGLKLLLHDPAPTWIKGSYLWASVIADLYARCDLSKEARTHYMLAVKNAPTKDLKKLLEKRFGRYNLF